MSQTISTLICFVCSRLYCDHCSNKLNGLIGELLWVVLPIEVRPKFQINVIKNKWPVTFTPKFK